MEVVLWVVLAIILVFGIVVVRGAPYVPSHRRYVKKSLSKLYRLSRKDMLVDLGSGDGLVLRIASQMGARAVGYELNPLLVIVSKVASWGDAKVSVKTADFWLIDLPHETTIVYAFVVSRDTKKLEQQMQEWANKKDDDLLLMTYGAKLRIKQPEKNLDAHALYRFTPSALQRPQA